MRIAILTQPLRYNFGGILQNYALQTVLRRMGHDVITLDPKRYKCKWFWQYPILIIRHIIARYVKGYQKVPLLADYLKDKETKQLGINTFRFIDTYIQRKEYYDSRHDIRKNDFDAFVVGSDQTWRYQYNYSRIFDMFLCFTKGWNVRRIAYAASFGIDEWEGDSEITKTCSDAIKHFDLVTVREYSGIDICRNVFNIDAQHVLDPTLLLCKDDYISLINERTDLRKKDGELYLYILDENEENKRLASDLVKLTGMQPFTYHSKVTDWKTPHTIEERIQLPVELWLSGFDQAEIVFTDSFHACVFSIIFRKQFYLYANNERGMERYTSLFRMLGINNRAVRCMEDVKNMLPIDYDILHKKLKELQEESIFYFNDILK